MKWGVMILAAGEASRMGKAKMLLPYNETTILGHILNEVNALSPDIIKIVTGHYHDLIKKAIVAQQASITFNPNYMSGMSSSIQLGLAEMQKDYPQLAFVIIMVSDQPFINRFILSNLIDQKIQMHKGIVAASYNGILGTPVLLSDNYFEHLHKLTGDKGARGILQQFPNDTASVDFELGELDIDTDEDYRQFCKKLNEKNVD
jgi:molybdenum cofactor cytidylyltransferase